LRWEDGADQDMRGQELEEVRPQKRDEWAKLLKNARAHRGMSSQ